jgi:TonB family protein
MSAIHPFIHDLVSQWFLFAAILALVASAALAASLGVDRRGRRLFSARSRYALVAIALATPLVGLLLIPAAAGAWGGLLLFAEEPPVAAVAGEVDASIELAAVAPADERIDAVCLVAMIWIGAFLLIAFWRLGEWIRWRRHAALAPSLADARVLALFENAWKGSGAPPPVRSDPTCEEPMVVGLLRPVILLPFGYGEAMDDVEIEAVAVHEHEHVMRRDNLTAAVADLLASLFWFDPFHWIARRRLLELREGACDERVLAQGLPARAYLSALAKTSHAGFESPAVACMSGFRVRERMESIMSYPNDRPQWIPERAVGAASAVIVILLAVAIAGFAPAGAAEAAPASGEHALTIVITPGPDGQVLIEAEVRDPEGTLVSAPRIMALGGQPVDTSTTIGGREYKLNVTPAADGSGFAKLEVREGDRIIDTVVRSIEAPATKMRKPAERISLTLRDADVRDFARTLSQLTGIPVVVAVSAQGKVTIDVRDMPWDVAVAQALTPLDLRLAMRDGQALIVPAAASSTRSPLPPPPPGYFRVGGDVRPPQVVSRVDPLYPPEARAERVQGIVIIEALIGEDGLIRDVKLLKDLPYGMGQAAVDAVRQWTFVPATKDGKVVPVVFNLTVNFKLDAGEPAP